MEGGVALGHVCSITNHKSEIWSYNCWLLALALGSWFCLLALTLALRLWLLSVLYWFTTLLAFHLASE